MLDIRKRILSLIPASWWAWRIWRVLNPVHFALAWPGTWGFTRLGLALRVPLIACFVLAMVSLLCIGLAHEQGDGDLDRSKTPTAPYEGLKDMWSFVVGGLFYYLIRYAVMHG